MADISSNSDEHSLRRRARRRLVGAIALALVVVVVLPMIFDPQPKPLTGNVEILIPSPNSTFEDASSGDNIAPAADVQANVPAPLPAEPPVPSHKALPDSSIKPAVVAPPVQSDAGRVVEGPKAATPSAVEQKSKAVVAPPDGKPVAKTSEVKPAGTKPAEVKPTAKPADPKPDLPAGVKTEKPKIGQAKVDLPKADKPTGLFAANGYYLQLGAFSSEANARQLVDQAKAAGYAATTVTSAGQSKVRVGPFGEREKAMDVQAKLKAKGLASVLIGP